MGKNLVLTAAVGYKFNQIELFIKSLRKYYSDHICIVSDHSDKNIDSELMKLNCEVIKTKVNKKEIQFKRYKIFKNYLKDKDFENILLCDGRDIYFQDNPFNFNFEGPINFFLEDYQIKNCPFNSNWIIKTYGQEIYNEILDKTILCSGTVLGINNKIIEYLDLINYQIENFKYRKRLKYFLTFRPDPEGRGCDQGHANFLVHKTIIKDVSYYSNEGGPFATVYYLKKINFDNSSRLVNNRGEPYLLVHQYDKRWSEFSNAVNSLKKELNVF